MTGALKTVGGALAALVGLAGCAPESHPAASRANMAFEAPVHAFGQVAQGTVLRHRFFFTNRGSTPLRIDRLRAACTCRASAPSERVPPSARASVDVECDTADFFGPERYTVTVYSNDAEHPARVLALAGEVEAIAAADPPRLYTGRVRPGQTVGRQVEVWAGDGVRIESAAAAAPLSVTLGDVEPPRNGKRLTVAIDASAPPGRFESSIRVRTSDARRRELEIAVVGEITAEAGR